MENKISAIIPVYNGEKTIEETLKSLSGVVNEILVIHDGPCTDNTLKISKKYTNKIYVQPRKGRSAFPFAFGLKKAKYNWVLKMDDDESLSEPLRTDIKYLIESKDVDAYSFIHPLWDGKKAITKTWPRKTILVRKSKISYLGFPGFDMNINHIGKTKKTNYILFHKPRENQDVGFNGFREKVLNRYAPSQAKNIFKPFSEFPRFQYSHNELPFKIKIKKFLPLIINPLYGILVFFKQLFYEGSIKEGLPALKVAAKTLIYNIYLGYLIQKEKINSKKK